MKRFLIILILSSLLLSAISFADGGTTTNPSGNPHPPVVTKQK